MLTLNLIMFGILCGLMFMDSALTDTILQNRQYVEANPIMLWMMQEVSQDFALWVLKPGLLIALGSVILTCKSPVVLWGQLFCIVAYCGVIAWHVVLL
jgi:hypothetical protein